jgi:carbamoyl-phosphate synthase large subunit
MKARIDSKVKVLVTGAGGGGNGEQLVKCLKLKDQDYTVVATDSTIEAARLSGGDICKVLPLASDPNYTNELIALCLIEGVRAIFPGSEPELRRISSDREKIQPHVKLLAINSERVIDICSDKFKTNVFLERQGFPFPKSIFLQDTNQIELIDFFPVVLKPTVGGGSQHVYIAQNRKELGSLVSYLLGYFDNFLVQEYVGTVNEEYTVGVLLDGDGNLINSIAVRRFIMSSLSNRVKVENLTDKKELGSVLAISSGISQGEIGKFPDVTKFCEKLAVVLGSKYAINVQCRLVDGVPYVFEINPRFSGTSFMRAMVGYNEPDLLIRKHVLGLPVESDFDYDSGVILRSLNETLTKK